LLGKKQVAIMLSPEDISWLRPCMRWSYWQNKQVL